MNTAYPRRDLIFKGCGHARCATVTVTSSMARRYSSWVTDTQQEVLDECVQLHGGYGYMNEYLVCRLFADSRVQRIYGATNEIMKELISRAL